MRSRKRKDADGKPIEREARKKFKHTSWNLEQAVAEVLRVADHFNEKVYIPSRQQFAVQNQSYLYNLIFGRTLQVFAVSRATFAKRVGLKWQLGRSAKFSAVS